MQQPGVGGTVDLREDEVNERLLGFRQLFREDAMQMPVHGNGEPHAGGVVGVAVENLQRRGDVEPQPIHGVCHLGGRLAPSARTPRSSHRR